MSNIIVELDHDGMEQLLKSPGMQAVLQEYAEQVRSRCTAGNVDPSEYATTVKVSGTRAVARVYPATRHARNSNRAHNTLLKALGGRT